MLFSSFEFILVFLPLSFLGFFSISRFGLEKGLVFLVFASLIFYGYWNPTYLLLIIASIVFNFFLGGLVNRAESKVLLAFGIGINLLFLIYFKYLNFIVQNLNENLGSSIEIDTIVLPLAISFFTFQQIAYLVDSYRGETEEYNFIHYCLFVTFFPQLIAGPIVHHKQMMPQFMKFKGINAQDVYIGLCFFTIGLFKKVVIADSVAPIANAVFVQADSGVAVTSVEAWLGALAYTVQLYFDFSGYADMAIGAARMFGVRLPFNFNSPYRANNIIDFWRRWHITLSSFLRDYLYIPLGGNRSGKYRKFLNLMITMLLGGLWHGAGWNFLIWGGLHGSYLCLNHFWIFISRQIPITLPKIISLLISKLLTILAVVVAWVFFRAETYTGAIIILESMGQFSNLISELYSLVTQKVSLSSLVGERGDSLLSDFQVTLLIIVALIVSMVSRNSQQVINQIEERQNAKSMGTLLQWRPLSMGLILSFSLLALNTIESTEFLYFQF